MQELRLVLIIVGTLAIAALLLHGLWSSRKEKPAKFGEKPIGKLDESNRDTDGFDRDGVGSVRVVGEPEITPPTDAARLERKEPALHFGSKLEADPLLAPLSTVSPVNEERPVATAKELERPLVAEQLIAPSATPVTSVSNAVAEPHRVVTPPEPVIPAVSNVGAETVVLESTLTIEDIERDAAKATETIESTVVPEAATHEVVIESVIEEAAINEVAIQAIEVAEPEVTEPTPVAQAVLPPDFLVLNVHARKGELLRGSKLFNAFEQHNLIFGENAVYHRHSDMAGTGPVVFTVTNMVHPAHFPEGGSDSFETPGVAFYLMLPCEAGRADQSFNQMLQTVQRIADSLGADVLDHERSLITPRRITEYREKALRYATS